MKIVLTKEQAILHLKSRFESMFGTVLSREQIEVEIVDIIEENKPDSEGWIINTSITEDCPEHLKGKRVEVVLRDGQSDNSIADEFNWIIEDESGDVVKYRMIE